MINDVMSRGLRGRICTYKARLSVVTSRTNGCDPYAAFSNFATLRTLPTTVEEKQVGKS